VKGLQNVHITDMNELKQRLGTEWAKLDHVVIAAGIVNGVVDSSRSVVIHVLNHCIHLLQYFPTRCYQLDSNLPNLEDTVEVR